MGALDLLQWFRRDGFALSLQQSGGLVVRPASKLTDAHRQALKDNKAAIVDALNSPVPAFDPDAYPERAAIMEYDGDMSRDDAETAAALICGEALDPDRHCSPHTTAMNTLEIDIFTARLHLFTRHGLEFSQAEQLADSLVQRDRGNDDRRLCLECAHLQHGAGLWGCNQWRRAGLGAVGVPGDLVTVLQRCEGFKNGTVPQGAKQGATS